MAQGDAATVLVRDRYDKFGPAFDRAAQGVGAKVIKTAPSLTVQAIAPAFFVVQRNVRGAGRGPRMVKA